MSPSQPIPLRQPACLVTGCAGFIGGHLCRALLDAGHAVVGVDNFFSGSREALAPLLERPGFCFHERSVEESGLLAGIKRRHPDIAAVFHLAAVVSVALSFRLEGQTLAVNHEASLRLAEDARDLGIPAFVFAGSAAEFGENEQAPLDEDAAGPETVTTSPYGRSKQLVTQALLQRGLGCSLRLFNVYGPGQDPESPYSGVVSRFISQSLRGEPLGVYGDGGQSRDFVHVSDVVRALVLAAGLDGRAPLRGVYNVGSGSEVTILELARLIQGLTGSRAGVRLLPPRDGDLRRSLADVRRIREAVGFAARVGLRLGLADTVAAARADLALAATP